MQQKTEAIVLSLQKHTDTSCILHLYTREYGRVQYMVYGRKGASTRRKNGINLNILSPLSVVEVTADSNPSKSMAVLHSASLAYIPSSIPQNVERQCIALFIAEALYKTLVHPMEDPQLFDYLRQLICELDLSDSVAHIPAAFQFRLSQLLGYGGEPIEELKNIKSAELLQMTAIPL